MKTPPPHPFCSPSPTTLSFLSWPPSEDKPSEWRAQRPYPPSSPPFLSPFPSLLTSPPYHLSFSLPFSLFLSLALLSPSPTPGPTVIGIPSGSWDPYKHSRQGERERARQSVCVRVCVRERERERERERGRHGGREKEKASKSIRWFIRALSHSGRCLVCLCLSNTLP